MNVSNHAILFWLGVLGIVFYVAAPILFPKVPNLRQPELLPVYTLMLGLGQLLKGSQSIERAKELVKDAQDDKKHTNE